MHTLNVFLKLGVSALTNGSSPFSVGAIYINLTAAVLVHFSVNILNTRKNKYCSKYCHSNHTEHTSRINTIYNMEATVISNRDIPHICHFWYATKFFRPVKGTPKKCVNLRQKLHRDKTA